MATITGRRALIWRRGDQGFTLHLGSALAPLIGVVPDTVHPGMWRVRHPDGALSDMVNLTRAKDAATALALGSLNRKQAQETPVAAPPVRQNEVAA